MRRVSHVVFLLPPNKFIEHELRLKFHGHEIENYFIFFIRQKRDRSASNFCTIMEIIIANDC